MPLYWIITLGTLAVLGFVFGCIVAPFYKYTYDNTKSRNSKTDVAIFSSIGLFVLLGLAALGWPAGIPLLTGFGLRKLITHKSVSKEAKARNVENELELINQHLAYYERTGKVWV